MNQEKHFIVDVLFVLALFSVFAVSALMLVTIGADVYKNTVDTMHDNYEIRTSTSYITQKIRQNDSLTSTDSGINISSLDGTIAICMPQEINQETYYTYIYYYDGYMRELLAKESSSLGGSMLEAGQKIMPVNNMKMFDLGNGLYSIEFELTDSTTQKILINTRLYK